MYIDWAYPIRHLPELLKGAMVSIGLTIVCFIGSFLLGLILSYIRYRKSNKILYAIVTCYIEIMRNTPFLVQLFFLFFGLPQLGIKFSALTAGILGLTLNTAAYLCEIFRAGLQSIYIGQWEASRSIGLSTFQSLIHVIIPQAINNVFPPLTNQFVIILFSTSILSVIDVKELTQITSILNSNSYRSIELFSFAILIYYAISATSVALFKVTHKKLFKFANLRKDG